jgi:hypothetical protein
VEWKAWNTANSPLPNNHVYKIAVDINNVKWFATGGGGVASLATYSGPYVRLSSPQGGELWEAGSTHEITWIFKDVARIRIEYSPDNGTTWNVIANNVDAIGQSYSWTLPQVQSFQCILRVTDVSNEKYTDTSNGVFTISPPFLKLIAPDGGEKWASGSVHPITWIAIGANQIKLEYSINDGASWQVINTIDAATGSYTWTVPSVESDRCRVRATDTAVAERTDTGDGPFTIMKPYITVTAPNGGENWLSGDAHQIIWQADGVNKVRIEYSVDGGLSWNFISKNVDAAPGTFTWWPLSVESLLCIVRVSDQEKAGVSDVSDGVFSIKVILLVEGMPREFAVFQNSPNPFNPGTTISFTIPKTERVTVDIFNLSGQKIGCALDGNMEPGRHSVIWKAGGLSAGMYFATVRAGAEVKTIKMLLVK